LQVFRDFRRLLGVFEGIGATLTELVTLLRADEGMADRLTKLEDHRRSWEADIEGVLLKAEGKLAASNNAEARTRTMKRHAERLADPLDIDGEGEPAAVPSGDVEGSEEGEMPAVYRPLAPIDSKQNAMNAKFAV